MLFFLENRAIKCNNSLRMFFALFIFVYVFTGGLLNLHSRTDNVAYAQAPQTLSQQTSKQYPKKESLSPMQVTQSVQNPINMTVTTTINAPQTQNQLAPQVTMQQAVTPQNIIERKPYESNPSNSSMNRDIYHNSVWADLVPRKQLYADPAYKPKKPKTTKKKTKTSKKKVAKKPIKKTIATTKKASQNTMPSVKKEDRIKLDSGTHVMIQPGSNITVWADELADEPANKPNNMPANMPKNTPSQIPNNASNKTTVEQAKNTDKLPMNANTQKEMQTLSPQKEVQVLNSQNTMQTPVMNNSQSGNEPSINPMTDKNIPDKNISDNSGENEAVIKENVQNSELPKIQIPAPVALPRRQLSLEPSFGTMG